jgi:NAD+-dependent protein deacetylase sirtuin 4
MIKQLHLYARSLPKVFFSSLAKNVSSSPETYVPPHREPFKANVEQLEEFLSRSQRLFVLTGAGISTESGIPDYRSEGVGLYARTTNRPM